MLKDNLKYGIFLGLLTPFLGMIVFYLWKFKMFSVSDFFQVLSIQKSLLTSMISFSLFANAVIFTIFVNKHIDKTAKGIFISTILWAIGAFILKFYY